MPAEDNYADRSDLERTGPEQYAPRRRRLNNVIEEPHKAFEAELNAFEAEIHQLVRGGTPQVPQQRAAANAPGRPLNEDIDALIGRAIGEPLEEIDRRSVELQGIRNLLRQEGERVSREIAGYASLNDSVKTAMMTISESLRQWRSSARPVTGANDPAA
jgi:hypothetical protein